MLSFRVRVTEDTASPAVGRIVAGLADRIGLHRAIGNRVKVLIAEHVTRRNLSRRNKLGAPSSRFWELAAGAVAVGEVDQSGVNISLDHPGFVRAFGDVDIFPKHGIYLTIPQIAAAYNRRAYRVNDLFFGMNKRGKAFLAKKGKKPLEVWYSLVPSAHQPQDPTILPSDDQIQAAAIAGANDYVEYLWNKAN